MNCQDHQYRGMNPSQITRRWFFEQCGIGVGAAALAHLLAESGYAATDPLAPKTPPFAAKAKHVIFLFMAGAPSHLELFDYKPQLAKFDGTLPPPELLKGYRAAFINPNSKLLGPKFQFQRYGQSGAEMSEILPCTGEIVDDIAIVKSMVTDAFNHAPGQLLMNTGTMQFGRPSMGSWALYGLGSETRDLPGFVVFSSGTKGPSGGDSCWGSGFLPTVYQGVEFRTGGDPVLYLSNPAGVDRELQRDSLDALKQLNEMRLGVTGDPEMATRINSFEMAFRMQAVAPDLMDIAKESKETLELYGAEPGKASFANNCLLARRLVEKGVRFVQLYHEAWDQHANLVKDLRRKLPRHRSRRRRADQRPETPRSAGRNAGRLGRRIRPHSHGARRRPTAATTTPTPSPCGWPAAASSPAHASARPTTWASTSSKDRVHVHDLHATMLQLLGFDHTRLTYKFQGRNFRLTDVAGQVVEPLIA